MATWRSEELTVSSRSPSDGIDVVAVTGELDVDSATRLRAELSRVLARGTTTVVVDLSRVTFCDSVGLAALVAAWKRLPPGGALRLAGCGTQLRIILAATGLNTFMPGYPTVEDALAADS